MKNIYYDLVVIVIFYSLILPTNLNLHINQSRLTPSVTITDQFLYNGGNGDDYYARGWSNIREAVDDLSAFYSSKIDDIEIVIIDSGLSQEMWEEIEGDVTIGRYIQVNVETVTTTTDQEDEIVSDFLGHGSAIAQLISKCAPGVTLWIVELTHYYVSELETTLDYLESYTNTIDIVSMSFESPTALGSNIEDSLQYLKNNGVALFAASGNAKYIEGNWDSDEEMGYPAKYSYVWGIGALFDAYEQNDNGLSDRLENNNPIDSSYHGKRVTRYLSDDFDEREGTDAWGSKYEEGATSEQDGIAFYMPGFDIEIKNQDKVCKLTDGTSFATPHAAAAAAMVMASYWQIHGSRPSPSTLFSILKDSAERSGENYTPKPSIRATTQSPDIYREQMGWGSIDVYEAILFARGGEIEASSEITHSGPVITSHMRLKIGTAGTYHLEAHKYESPYPETWITLRYTNNYLSKDDHLFTDNSYVGFDRTVTVRWRIYDDEPRYGGTLIDEYSEQIYIPYP